MRNALKFFIVLALLCGARSAWAADASILYTPGSGGTNGAVTGPGNSKGYPAVTLGDGTNPDTQKLGINSSGQAAIQLPPGAATSANQPPLATPGTIAASGITATVYNKPIVAAPAGGNVAILATVTSVITAATFSNFAEFQVQGSAGVCASWVTSSITISGTTCTGAGAFYYAPLGSYRTPAGVTMPNSALYAIAAAASTASVVYQGQ